MCRHAACAGWSAVAYFVCERSGANFGREYEYAHVIRRPIIKRRGPRRSRGAGVAVRYRGSAVKGRMRVKGGSRFVQGRDQIVNTVYTYTAALAPTESRKVVKRSGSTFEFSFSCRSTVVQTRTPNVEMTASSLQLQPLFRNDSWARRLWRLTAIEFSQARHPNAERRHDACSITAVRGLGMTPSRVDSQASVRLPRVELVGAYFLPNAVRKEMTTSRM